MIRAIHVEDESRNIELLADLVKTYFADKVIIEGYASNISDAKAIIREKKPALVFLDIELNGGNSFTLLEELPEIDFHIIFITAFSEYAVKAFRYEAIDYLLKPISIEELREAIEKVIKKIEHPLNKQDILNLLKQIKESEIGVVKIGVPLKNEIYFIDPEEIIKIEAIGSYCNLYLLNGKKITTVKTLKDMETSLIKSPSFVRVHNSWIINAKYLKKYFRGKSSYIEMSDGTSVPVSVRKKGKFIDFYNM